MSKQRAFLTPPKAYGTREAALGTHLDILVSRGSYPPATRIK